ncbi:DUF4232 domain-containing protein [Streptomyces sp. NBC_01198]|uniref:DUF4232 domain-containing protein n=1 Tax=Streptomyces sp. NBC_01198 TaxID=2903769 RepID=UPI002E111B82|nr:DUF4232 domain-containing protein [Streptomyces sp. NBC_01198]
MPISSQRPATADPLRVRRRRTVLVAATVVLLSAAAAGCGDGAASGSPAGSTGAPSSSAAVALPGSPEEATGDAANGATGTAPPSSAGTAPPAATSGAARPRAAVARCTVTGLKMTLGRGDPGAGNIYYPLDFTNTSSHTCTLDGFPGVSLLRGDGSVIGKPAGREGRKPAAVRIAPGRTVEADLHTLNQGVKGDSCWRKPTLIMVYPPGSTDSMTLATSNPVVCGDTFGVGPVH